MNTGIFAVSVIGNFTKANPGRWADETYAESCWGYRAPIPEYEPSFVDGYYRIAPPNAKQANFVVFCDMTTDGGGWTAVDGFQIRDQWGADITELAGTCAYDDEIQGPGYPGGNKEIQLLPQHCCYLRYSQDDISIL